MVNAFFFKVIHANGALMKDLFTGLSHDKFRAFL